jgi:Flp pilus assembly protein TadG
MERPSRVGQKGSSALELALVSLLAFVPLLFGIVQAGLVFFSLNFAGEATRYVARAVVVCDKSSAQQETIKAHVIGLLPMVFNDATEITISYNDPAACIVTLNTSTPCVTVTITPGVNVPNFIPFVPIDWKLPTMRTTLTPESFASAIDGSPNPVCN